MPSTLVEGGTEVKEWLKSFWRPSDNKPDIDYLQVLVNINSHAWDGDQIWSTQGRQTCCVVLMQPIHIPCHMLWCVHGQGVSRVREKELIYEIYIAETIPSVTYLSTQMKPWIKHQNIILERGLTFLFLNVAFVFHLVALWTCSRSFPSLWCTLTWIRMECNIVK